jgi:GrpB-like predicted nucleotidyltransferase (UPF0157 family)
MSLIGVLLQPSDEWSSRTNAGSSTLGRVAVRRTRRRDDIIFVVRHDNPAQLVEPDPGWAAKAAALLAEIQGVIVGLDGADRAAYDHIGSTSVQGLAAKPYLDLQIRILPLPSHDDVTARLGSLGFDQAHGSRRNSPGVTYDLPAPGDDDVPDEVWEKRLYVRRADGVILHLRRADSPWGRHRVWFRDWLHAHPEARGRYEKTKRVLSEAIAGKPDYDDYTRAKSAFFDEVRPVFVAWAHARRPRPVVQCDPDAED